MSARGFLGSENRWPVSEISKVGHEGKKSEFLEANPIPDPFPSRDPAAAGRLGTRLLDQAETLCRLPHRGGPVRRRPGVRKLVLRPWLIF